MFSLLSGKAMYRARPRRFRSVHVRVMFFRAGHFLSRQRRTTQCVPLVVQLCYLRTLSSWRLDLQRLSNLIVQRSEDEGKSQNSTLKLSHRVPLKKLVVVQRVESAVAEQSMEMAEKDQSQQTRRVIYGLRALPPSLSYVPLSPYWAFRPIK